MGNSGQYFFNVFHSVKDNGSKKWQAEKLAIVKKAIQ
jgi:hypothetical protein